jgi:NAD(P)-dependent dehydrogenase (short-subunit alcohol dehydrogenase family)
MRGSIFLAAMAAVAMLSCSGDPRPAAAQEPATEPLSYAGKTVFVTGSTDGLGRSLALALAAQGAHVIVHGRDATGAQEVLDAIEASGVGSADFYPADFGSLQTIRELADTIGEKYPKIDLLVSNAGISLPRDQPRRTSDDGHELAFQVNYLAGWMLVNELRPNLAAAAPSRVVNISSISANPIDWDDLMLEAPGANARGYGQSKLAQVTMTVALAPSFAEDGITMIAVHPATMMDTTMVRNSGRPPMTTVEEGRDHVMSLITAPTLQPGAFYVGGRVTPPANPQPGDPAARLRLLEVSTQLTGVGIR